MGKTVLVPVAQGSEEMETVIIIDMLRRAGLRVIVAADTQIVTCSRGVKIIPDVLFDDIEPDDEFDAIIIPGGMPGTEYLRSNPILKDILKKHNKKGELIGAICAAPVILTSHKILSEKSPVTSHPSVKNELIRYDYKEDDVVQAENVITSRGAGTAFDFTLRIIEILAGKEKAEQIAGAIVYKK